MPAQPIFTFTNVREQLKRLKSKSPGPDGLSPTLLRSSRHEIVDVLTHMFNNIVNEGIIPEQWKGANIVPIPKVSHPEAPGDYRPISILSALGKAFERILARHILVITRSVWENNKHYGFLPNKGTMDAIVQVINDWGEAKDRKNAVTAIFFDFAKAF